VSNTINIPIQGKPSSNIIEIKQGKNTSIKPFLIPFITAKLAVKKGDEVKIGSIVFFDKKDTDLVYLSPVCGIIDDIIYGKKRRIENVIIRHNDKIDEENYKSFKEDEINSSSKEELKTAILKGGLWGVFQEFPFKNIPNTKNTLEKDIYVSMDNDEPYHPESSVYLKDSLDEFNFGIKSLKALFKNVHIGVADKNTTTKDILDNEITHSIKGHYPANNIDTFLYYNKTSADENSSFGINGQDVIKIGYLLKHGKYPTSKIITLAGSELKDPTHLKIQEGTSISSILRNEDIGHHRVIAGGVYSGRTACSKDYLGFNEYAIHILSEDIKQDLFGFFKPGFDKPTQSKTYMSFFLPKKSIQKDVSLYGEPRSCISCSYCSDVCSIGLMPQLIMKDLYANQRASALSQGMLDCNDCGMCTYVCTSKIELSDIIKQAKDGLYKELNK
jgi:Na+-transporting NADH:ubiquinone oxidoreductase subunit A